MNEELRELYQSVILDHSRKPRNYGELHGEGCLHVHGDNPSCGDEIDVFVKLNSDRISELTFTGQGCAISQASASMMTQKLKGRTRDEAVELAAVFRGVVTGEGRKLDKEEPLGDLTLLEGVQQFPARVKCAMLAWRALEQAVGNTPDSSVTTEE
ncbi:MAG: SUF system NifU family Fe-S cluster assembly protein [Verrucomicrobiaceae bacterium]|nr:SUF system NifU family Fe-S cluster assembly protein [Verrucomicrobiaceae bacterium]